MISIIELFEILKNQSLKQPLIKLFDPCTLYLRYITFPELPDYGGFILTSHYLDRHLSKDEVLEFFTRLLSNYMPDEMIEHLNSIPRPEQPKETTELPKKVTKFPGHVYLLEGAGYYKIGRAKDISVRLQQISPRLPFKVRLLHTIKTDDMVEFEKALHNRFQDKRTNGEWFALDEADVAWFMEKAVRHEHQDHDTGMGVETSQG